MTRRDVKEYWWDDNDLHIIYDDGDQFIYEECYISINVDTKKINDTTSYINHVPITSNGIVIGRVLGWEAYLPSYDIEKICTITIDEKAYAKSRKEIKMDLAESILRDNDVSCGCEIWHRGPPFKHANDCTMTNILAAMEQYRILILEKVRKK